ncbi:MAG: AraC family transcriptional regulator [Lachnospiraceae bacterium]|nr:AraC family transcriptional regulator [Lachnospiraceae bacterium]
MSKSTSNRILATPSRFAKEHYLYVQEIGTLQSIEPHISKRQNLNSLLFLIVLKGSGNITYLGKVHEVHAGDCVFLNCNRPYAHESSAEDPWTLMWTHFYGMEASVLYEQFIEQNHAFIFAPESLHTFADTLSALYETQLHRSSMAELTSHKYLTDLITLCFTENRKQDSVTVSTADKLRLIRTWLEEHFSEKINLDDLSHLFYISKFHLSREYKNAFGQTLMNDLMEIRISHAKSLLRFSADSVEQIAVACGFQNAGYFIKVFKKAENMTPLEYRKLW